MKRKSFQERIITTASPNSERKKKKFATQIITTKDLSDEQIHHGVAESEPEEVNKNEEQKP